MMKKIVLLCFLLPCLAKAQQTFIDENENIHLWGKIGATDLLSGSYGEWYQLSIKNQRPEINPVISEKLDGVRVKIFMGTWCGDSRRWVPRFIEQWKALGLEIENLDIIGVHNDDDLYKQAPDQSEELYNIHRVPTFIFINNDKEIGRIVESPVNSLFSDIAQIALGYPSEPRYKGVTYLASIIDTLQLNGLDDPMNEKIAGRIYRDVSYIGELNTYAKKLYTEGKIKEAEWVYHLNTILYKYHPYVYQQMGAYYEKTDKIEMAVKMYYKSLSLEPENKNVIAWLSGINSSETNK